MDSYQKVGGEVDVYGFADINSHHPHVAGLADGGYVVTWTQSMGDPYEDAVRAAIYDAAGNQVAGLSVNTNIRGYQNQADVTALEDGRFVVTWYDEYQFPIDPIDDYGAIRGQLFTAAGDKIGGEFLIPTTVAGEQYSPAVAALEGGGFAVIWGDGSGDPDPDTLGVRAQVFDPLGAKVGGEVLVPVLARGDQAAPDISGLPGGGFVAVWADNGAKPGDTSEWAVMARIFDDQGLPITGEFLVNTSAFLYQYAPKVATLASGGFIVTWYDESGQGGDDEPTSIKAQLFDSAGAKIGGEFLVNTSTASGQIDPAVSDLPGGGFVIAWMDHSGEGGDADASIKAQVFDGAGTKVGDEFLVNSFTDGYQRFPDVSTLANGDIVFSWNDPAGMDGALHVKTQVFSLQPPDPGTNDTLTGDGAANILSGRNGDDILFGLAGPDQLYGGDGDDILKGGVGDDRLDGGLGIDTADYAEFKGGGVTVDLAAAEFGGQDTGAGIDSLSGIENLRGSRQADTLSGDSGNNRIKGETGADVLFGAGGDDLLSGDGGDDILDGGEGLDTLAGGAGLDTFVFTTLDGDIVKDWQAGDKIDISAMNFQTDEVQLTTQYGRTTARFDIDEDGVFDDAFIVIHSTSVSLSDFVF